jgi:hypothetical protein
MSQYAVVQQRFEKIDHEDLRAILVEQGKLTRPDAARTSRRAQGILWERFDEQQAEHVAAALAQRGYAVRVVPADKLPAPKRPRTVLWLDINEEGLGVPSGSTQSPFQVAWPNVFVISAGEIWEVTEKLVSKRVMYSSINRMPQYEQEVQRSGHLIHVTDLLALSDDGQCLHVRLPAHELAYDRLLGTSDIPMPLFQKYLEVLEKLVARSTAALVSPPTRRLLVERKERHEPSTSESRPELDELHFENYNRWLLQLVIFKEQEQP